MTDLRDEIDQQCAACGGEGRVRCGELLVTREMALDAECPGLEGSHYDYEYEACQACGGDGLCRAGN